MEIFRGDLCPPVTHIPVETEMNRYVTWPIFGQVTVIYIFQFLLAISIIKLSSFLERKKLHNLTFVQSFFSHSTKNYNMHIYYKIKKNHKCILKIIFYS